MTNSKSVDRTLFGLSSTLPPNKSKTLYNHVAIHIFVKIAKKERAFEFLVPLQVLCFITRNTVRNNTNKKPLLRKKKAMRKNIIVIMTSQRQITIFLFTSRVSIVKTPHCPTILDQINRHL